MWYGVVAFDAFEGLDSAVFFVRDHSSHCAFGDAFGCAWEVWSCVWCAPSAFFSVVVDDFVFVSCENEVFAVDKVYCVAFHRFVCYLCGEASEDVVCCVDYDFCHVMICMFSPDVLVSSSSRMVMASPFSSMALRADELYL